MKKMVLMNRKIRLMRRLCNALDTQIKTEEELSKIDEELNNIEGVKVEVLERPNKEEVGALKIDGKVYHKIDGVWIVCGDCKGDEEE